MRSIWKGSVAFGLVNIPVKLYAATGEHDVRFHQVHVADGGRIRYKRTCEACGEVVEYRDIAKGFESDDGQLVMLTSDDFDQLPVASGHEIDVMEFVPADQVDPLLMDKSYYLEPDGRATKPYALLREALTGTDRMAVVKVALRQRETLAVLRVRDKVIVLQTLLWPDEVRAADFSSLGENVDLRPQEVTMATSLVESLASDFEPDQYEDDYKLAMQRLIEAKLEGDDSRELLRPDTTETGEDADVVDLVAALRKSVESARAGRSAAGAGKAATTDGSAQDRPADEQSDQQAGTPKAAGRRSTSTRKAAAKKQAASKPAAKKAAKKTSAKKTAKKAAARKSA